MNIRITPTSTFFASRSTVNNRLVYALGRTNAVLLFGSRQSGKTALLRHLEVEHSKAVIDASVLSSHELYIYVDLAQLRYDASPSDFFSMLAARALGACEARIVGFTKLAFDAPTDLDSFVCAIQAIVAGCSQVDARLVFLLDEAKRVLGGRFPRGFQDNLFSLLFGEAGEQLKLAMVFAGNQHLNELLVDDTSPIGSRSQSVLLPNLTSASVTGLVQQVLLHLGADADANRISDKLMELTGGQAGLTARLLEITSSHRSPNFDVAAAEVATSSESLFENWVLSMSPEARLLASNFFTAGRISLQTLAARLQKNGLNKFLARRVFDEYEYTGIAIREGDELAAVNPLFWNYLRVLDPGEGEAVPHESVWSLIEQTELALRELVLKRLREKFGESAYDQMKKILGEKAWDKIQETLQKSQLQYRFVREPARRDLMSCMYLGQLGSLMINGSTWDLFKAGYRDKRELEDKLAAVMPVRNDRAHFCSVPEKELDRCRIACDDLLAIAERDLGIA
ncbi:MAG: AAA family ATPase [Ottowia sp.]|uniref:AAA family ATPase n=1 Tax=Ottowia sp. TaxID=1898956 RepID=UPI003C73FC21